MNRFSLSGVWRILHSRLFLRTRPASDAAIAAFLRHQRESMHGAPNEPAPESRSEQTSPTLVWLGQCPADIHAALGLHPVIRKLPSRSSDTRELWAYDGHAPTRTGAIRLIVENGYVTGWLMRCPIPLSLIIQDDYHVHHH